MASRNSVDISSLSTEASMTRRERGLLEKLDQLFHSSATTTDPAVDTAHTTTDPASTARCDHPPDGKRTTSSVKYALFALCSVCIQFALHYVSLISDTINSLFQDSSYIIKSICLFLLAYFSYKQVDRML